MSTTLDKHNPFRYVHVISPFFYPPPRRSYCYGNGMSVAIADTIGEIDEALRHLSLVPDHDRGPAWHAYSDALLERRAQLEDQHANT